MQLGQAIAQIRNCLLYTSGRCCLEDRLAIQDCMELQQDVIQFYF